MKARDCEEKAVPSRLSWSNRQTCKAKLHVHSHLRNLPALVVAAQDGDAVPKPYFQGHQQTDTLHTVIASIDVIPCSSTTRCVAYNVCVLVCIVHTVRNVSRGGENT
jgi:hypothetical protein